VPNLIRCTLTLRDAGPYGLLSTSWWQELAAPDVAQRVILAGTCNLGNLTYTSLETSISSAGSGAQPATSVARLYYRSAAGNLVSVIIPGALPGIYLPDHETVDPTNALIADLTMALQTYGVDGGGSPVTTYQSGTALVLRRPGWSI
jgi:hypothetical protein